MMEKTGDETTDVITTVGADPTGDTVVETGSYYPFIIIVVVLVIIATIGVIISKKVKKGKNQ